MLHGYYGCSPIDFMRLTNYKNELETKLSYHAFIMQMCMMNIFVVCFLHASCSRLIQPVEVYINWYMMCYLKKDMFCKEHIFFGCCIIFKMVCLSSVFGRSGHHPLPTGHFPHGTCSCICTYFCMHINFYNRMRDHI